MPIFLLLATRLDPPQPPLKRGENLIKVPLFKGDLGGSSRISHLTQEWVYTVAEKGRRKIRTVANVWESVTASDF
jgi:hypothetical protein